MAKGPLGPWRIASPRSFGWSCNERTLVRKFKRMLKEFGSLGLDVRALLDSQLPAPAESIFEGACATLHWAKIT